MSTSTATIRYRRKDGTEATAEIEMATEGGVTTWTVPDDCVAVTGWERPPASGFGGGGPYGHAMGPDVEPGRTWSGVVGGGADD